MSKTIAAESLTEGVNILVRGKISFSRLAAQITGEELLQRIADAKARKQNYYTKVPHTTVSIVDAQVIPLDPSNMTLEEQFVAERLFQYKQGKHVGQTAYSIDDISRNLPQVFAPGPDGKHRQVVLTQDLDSDLDVTLVLRTYKPKEHVKRGIGLAQVILNEPLRYYQAAGGADENALAALGVTIEGPVTRVSVDDAPQVAGGQVDPQAAQAPVPTQEDGLPGLPTEQAPEPMQQSSEPMEPMVQPPQQAPAQPQGQDQVEETPAQRIARLEAELNAMRGSGGPEGSSPFDAGQSGAGITL